MEVVLCGDIRKLAPVSSSLKGPFTSLRPFTSPVVYGCALIGNDTLPVHTCNDDPTRRIEVGWKRRPHHRVSENLYAAKEINISLIKLCVFLAAFHITNASLCLETARDLSPLRATLTVPVQKAVVSYYKSTLEPHYIKWSVAYVPIVIERHIQVLMYGI